MKPTLQALALLICSFGPSCAAHTQLRAGYPRVLAQVSVRDSSSKNAGKNKLKGKFLHITDIHPDPFYKLYSSTVDEHACHRGKGPAGYYGAETSDCDSPISLINATFDWIKDNLRDEIDFVIWTGDSARHDNDEKIPRSAEQVISQNQLVRQKFQEVWGKPDKVNNPDSYNDFTIPIVPTLGNNDILPHNIFLEGPNKWTKAYLDVWRHFIPEEQRHQFARGGWFYVEVIPNELAVFSLNTLYFFDSNSAVDGCSSKHEPGYEHFEWLRIQLEILRQRGMKAMLMGHVPPARVDSKMSWDETCWQKYTLWQKQYRDVIVANIFGHMNIDHFMLQDFRDIKKSFKKGKAPATIDGVKAKYAADEEFTTMSAQDYLIDLRNYFAKIPSIGEIRRYEADEDESWLESIVNVLKGKGKKKKGGKKQNPLGKIGGEFGERYSMSFVGPSVVPNFFSTLRVFEYNITGLENLSLDSEASTRKPRSTQSSPDRGHPKQFSIVTNKTTPSFIDEFTEDIARSSSRSDKELAESKKHKPKKIKFKVPHPPSKSAPPGPAYSPQTFTLLGYKQYYANLTHINNDFANAMDVDEAENDLEDQRWKEGKHSGKVRKGKARTRKFKYEVEYDTCSDRMYRLKDLTMRSYIDLAKMIGGSAQSRDTSFEGFKQDREEVDEELMDDVEGSKKGHKKKPKEPRNNKVWLSFVKRAFVGTVDPRTLSILNSEESVSNDTTMEGGGEEGAALEL